MAMSYIWVGMVLLSLVFSLSAGKAAAVGSAVFQGAGEAVSLLLSLAGPLLLWSGVMEVMRRAGLTERLAAALRRPLLFLFPSAAGDEELRDALCCNVSANLLGLGNAATPAGIRAATRLARQTDGIAGDELCRLVVLNTASVQLLPTTAAALRAAAGAAAPYDILPAVWVSSLLSVSAGLLAAALLRRWL